MEVLLPSGDGIFITLCMEEPRGRVPFPLPDNPLLDPGHSPEIETGVNGPLMISVQTARGKLT